MQKKKTKRFFLHKASLLFLTGAPKRRLDCLREVPVSAGCGTKGAGTLCQDATVENRAVAELSCHLRTFFTQSYLFTEPVWKNVRCFGENKKVGTFFYL